MNTQLSSLNTPVGARAAALSEHADRPQRQGFFPRAPGPNLIVFALIIGVAPSLVATFRVLTTGLDGGYYMPPEFISGQRQTLLVVYAIVALAALVAFGFVLRAMRSKPRDRGTHIAISAVLLATLVWDSYLILGARANVEPPKSFQDVADRAAIELSKSDLGPTGYTYDGRVFRVQMSLPEGAITAEIPRSVAGRVLCVLLGEVFRGPASSVGANLTYADGQTTTIDIPREQCRMWYLYDRRAQFRPRAIAHLSARQFLPLMSTVAVVSLVSTP